MKQESFQFLASSHRWLWLFPLTYFVHAIEEVAGLGAPHGINVSLTVFLILSTIAWLLMVCGIALAQRLGFPQFMAVCLGATVFLNGLSHLVNSVIYLRYDAGVISGTLVFIPLGLATLIGLRNSMRRQRYFTGVLVGIVIQAVALIIAA
jgi:uncharacterized membrane protein